VLRWRSRGQGGLRLQSHSHPVALGHADFSVRPEFVACASYSAAKPVSPRYCEGANVPFWCRLSQGSDFPAFRPRQGTSRNLRTRSRGSFCSSIHIPYIYTTAHHDTNLSAKHCTLFFFAFTLVRVPLMIGRSRVTPHGALFK
jgi:hypothetical protein